MKNNRGLFWIITGLLLIAAAVFLVGYNLYTSTRAESTAETLAQQLSAVIPTDNIPTSPLAAPASPETTYQLSEVEIPDYILNPEMEMPVVNIDGVDCIGTLSIPALELTLPVISQWNYTLLQQAPCRYLGSAYTKDLILMAHNYEAHFGRLHELQMGEQMEFTDADGNVFRYQVVAKEILMPTAVNEMVSGDWDLTLFTCTVGGANRVTVRCELTETE